MYDKLSKCEFWLEEVKFLGHVISAEGIAVDPYKVKVRLQWEHPKITTEIYSVLNGCVIISFLNFFYTVIKI